MPNATNNDDGRREYWTGQMEEATSLVDALLACPVAECGENVCSLERAVDGGRVDVVFSETPIAPGLARQFYLRQGLIPPFLGVAREMNDRGLILKVEDGYRSLAMQKQLALKPSVIGPLAQRVVWDCGGTLPSAPFLLNRLRVLVAHCPKTGAHMSGSAIDISVLNRDDRSEVDRGGPYLELSERTPMSSPFVGPRCRRNREKIRAIMRKHGFVAYPYEFWHYNAGDACAELLIRSGAPARYGPVHVHAESGRVEAVENPTAPLNTEEEIMESVERALRHVKES